jgi:DNA-directed RNA polymerase specialized sigma24 family protein
MPGLFDALDRDWFQLVNQRSSRRRYTTWAAGDPTFAAHADLAAFMAAARQRNDRERSDRILAALADRAGTDTLAARALLHAILPGLRALASTHHWVAPGDELEATIVAIAWHHIRSYPIANRPRRIAANLLLDTGHHLRHDVPRPAPTVPLEVINDLPSAPTHGSGHELTELVCEAVASGWLQPDRAELILRTRVLGQPIAVIAEQLGYPIDTIRHRRRRAERALRNLR